MSTFCCQGDHGLVGFHHDSKLRLFAVVGDPFWASAPLYALRLIGALSRVAGASRAVDLECCQREEATKLLAKVPGIKGGRGKGPADVHFCSCICFFFKKKCIFPPFSSHVFGAFFKGTNLVAVN